MNRAWKLPKFQWCFFSPGDRSFQVLSGDTSDSGGAEAQIAHLAKMLADEGHRVTLVYGNGSRRRPPTTVAGIRCFDAVAAWRRPSSVFAFWHTLRELAPDVIYARLPDDFLWLLGLFARFRRPRTRFLYALANDLHCRPGQAYDYNRWFHTPLYWLGLRSADRIAAQHQAQIDLMSPRLRSRMSCVPNLVRSVRDQPRPFGRTDYDAIWVARIRPVKQLGRFLDLADSSPDLRFIVVGGFDSTVPAEQRDSLERRMRKTTNVTYMGARKAADVIDCVTRSKVLVNTSDAEGFPNTMIEAWSAGVPVLSLSVDPGRIIEREKLGLVTGSADGLRNGLASLVHSEPLNSRCGARGMAYVRRHHSASAVHDALVNSLILG